MRKTFTILMVNFALLALNVSEVASAKQTTIPNNPNPCNVKVAYVHFSDSMLKSTGKLHLKANAKVKCNIRMDQLVLTVEIWKKGLLQDHKVRSYPEFATYPTPADKEFLNQSTSVECKNGWYTAYYARAQANGISNGITVSTPWVSSGKPELLCCGT